MHNIHGNQMPSPAVQPARSNTVSSRGSESPSSPTGSEGDKKGVFLQSIKDRARRSLSRESLPALAMTPREPPAAGQHVRRISKSAALDLLNRRNSGYSDDRSGVSRTPTTLSQSSSSSINWRLQKVEGVTALEPDTQLLRTRKPYLVVTSDYLVKLKNHSDIVSLFPQTEQEAPSRPPGATPEPLFVIPIGAIVSVCADESARYPFGFEVWWRVPDTPGFRHVFLCFAHPMEREEQMHRILNAVRRNNDEPCDYPKYPWPVEGAIRRLFEIEEPKYQHHKLEIYPVVPRGATRRDSVPKSEDKSTRSLEGHSFYLAIGANFCFYIEAWKGNNKPGEVSMKHVSFGLVTLQRFKGNWTSHDERFDITFR